MEEELRMAMEREEQQKQKQESVMPQSKSRIVTPGLGKRRREPGTPVRRMGL
jgi:hypothetical protein